MTTHVVVVGERVIYFAVKRNAALSVSGRNSAQRGQGKTGNHEASHGISVNVYTFLSVSTLLVHLLCMLDFLQSFAPLLLCFACPTHPRTHARADNYASPYLQMFSGP